MLPTDMMLLAKLVHSFEQTLQSGWIVLHGERILNQLAGSIATQRHMRKLCLIKPETENLPRMSSALEELGDGLILADASCMPPLRET